MWEIPSFLYTLNLLRVPHSHTHTHHHPAVIIRANKFCFAFKEFDFLLLKTSGTEHQLVCALSPSLYCVSYLHIIIALIVSYDGTFATVPKTAKEFKDFEIKTSVENTKLQEGRHNNVQCFDVKNLQWYSPLLITRKHEGLQLRGKFLFTPDLKFFQPN